VGNTEDKARFARVVIPHLDDALALAKWITNSGADAEDVVQEACLRAFRAIGSFGGVNSRAWVLAIVRNSAYSWLGKNRNVQLIAISDCGVEDRVYTESGWDGSSANAATPETELITKTDAVRLEAAISALPTEFREVLVLRDLQGFEYKEIADVIGAPVGTVMSRLARARRRIIESIGAQKR
jgi:RNA polymerase sigma factor (sigma-70 family)